MIELRVGTSRGAICPYCRATCARLPDGSMTHAGRIADLVPTDPPMHVGDRGTLSGQPFTVIGRQQLDHGAGPWDELYIVSDAGDARWLANAQGRWFVTGEANAFGTPAVSSLFAGLRLPDGPLAGYTAYEVGRYVVVSAEGELPLPIRSGDAGIFADLEAPGGRFATLDEDGEARRLYVGTVVDASAVVVTDRAQRAPGETPPATPEPMARRLECSKCGAPIELFAPGSAERVACAYCGALLDVRGKWLGAYASDERARAAVQLPLGSEGTLRGERMRVIGYLRKSCVVEDELYGWDEYLLATERGFAWLSIENGHCTLYVDAVRSEVVETGDRATYRGKTFHLFSDVVARVDAIVGEFTYQVTLGESVGSREYIAPPSSISVERTGKEISCSAGTYVKTSEVFAAFGAPHRAPAPIGVGTLEPVPWPHVGLTGVVLFALLAFVQVLLFVRASDDTLARGALVLPTSSFSATGGAGEPGVTLIDGIVVPRTTILAVELTAQNLVNGWIESNIALVNRDTGDIFEMSATAERYSGVTDGEAWSEGETSPRVTASRVPPGRYLLRAETAWDRWPSDPYASLETFGAGATIEVTRDEGGTTCCCCVGVLFLLPMAAVALRRAMFRSSRWSESNVTSTGSV